MVETTDRLVRTGSHVEAQVDEDLILMHQESGRMFAMRRTGIRIWERIDGERTVGQIVDDLLAIYPVDRDRCTAEVTAFLASLHEAGFVAPEA